MRSAVVRRAGGIRTGWEVGIDYDLVLRMSEIAPIAHLAEPLYEYRVHEAQISTRHRVAQRQASQHAIRDAIVRRGLVDQIEVRVDDTTGRFSLQAKNDTARRTKWRLPRTLYHRVRAQSRQPRPTPRLANLRVAQVWPDLDEELLSVGLRDGLHRSGIARRRGPAGLPEMIRSPTRSVPDVIFLHRVDDLLSSDRPGERSAKIEMLRWALCRVRAQQARVVWVQDTKHEANEILCDAVGRWCDHRVAAYESSVPIGPYIELLPVFRREPARASLGWSAADRWTLVLDPRGEIPSRSLASLEGPAAICQQGEHPWLKSGRPDLHPIPWPRTLRDLAQLVAGADVVQVPSAASASLVSTCLSLGRPVVGPDGAKIPSFIIDWRSVVQTWLSPLRTGIGVGG